MKKLITIEKIKPEEVVNLDQLVDNTNTLEEEEEEEEEEEMKVCLV